MCLWIVFLSEFIYETTSRKGESEAATDFIHALASTIIDRTTNLLNFIERFPEKEVIMPTRRREDNKGELQFLNFSLQEE